MHVVLRIIRTSVRSDLPAAIVQTNQVAKEIKAVMNEETGCDQVWVKLRDGSHQVAKEVCGEMSIE